MNSAQAPILLKLGGALLTQKSGRQALRRAVLYSLAKELAVWRATATEPLVLAHGSGSFAHVAVRETGFLERSRDARAGARVAAAARRLNVRVVEALIGAGLPAVGLAAGLLVTCENGQVVEVRAELVDRLLTAGLLPVVYGDVALDLSQGLAVASTEPVLAALADALGASRLVLATDVDGVFEADPHVEPGARPLALISPANVDRIVPHLAGAHPGATDVTGGMASKVRVMLDLVARRPDLDVRIVSGLRPGALSAALSGALTAGGTRLTAGD